MSLPPYATSPEPVPSTPDFLPISDYALIGDCHSTALVSRSGSIDWACLRQFDCAPAFVRLLDRHGGSFRVVPREVRATERRYLPDTNVLETTFHCAGGTLKLLDAFAMRPGGRREPFHQLMRALDCTEGSVAVEVELTPRFDYGSLHPWLRDEGHGRCSAVGGDEAIVLWSDAPITVDARACALRSEITLAAGQRRRFSLVAYAPERPIPEALTPEELDQRLLATADWWRAWTARGHYPEEHREAVVRSALLLKLLTCAPTGAIVAAPTTSLPEALGDGRNWDYRYAWVRDASLAMMALLSVGHTEVARGLWRFLRRASAGAASEMQVLYGSRGERRVMEYEIAELEGYRGSRPVRVGNAAHRQLQLDVYGEMLEAAYVQARTSQLGAEDWGFLASVVDEAARRCREPDCGIWETRAAARHYVDSKVMCWVALDRGIRIAESRGFPADLPRWRQARDEIRRDVDAHGVDPRRGCFVQTYGSQEVDASLLRLGLVGFVAPDDPRFVATVEAIEHDLREGDLVRRYRAGGDGIGTPEGGFLLCSFWLVEAYARMGRLDDARALYARLVARANDVGLLPEQIDPQSGEFLGNFPQAFSHMAVILAAQQLQPGGRPRHE